MNVIRAASFKALLLLIAFSMSTVVGFACSFSDLFHEFHHHNGPADKAHKHTGQNEHTHGHSGSHHDSPREEKKGNCCSHSIVELQKVEKSISRSIEALNLNSIIPFVAVYSELFSLPALCQTIFADFVRWRPPATIQDLRILIQSFQI